MRKQLMVIVTLLMTTLTAFAYDFEVDGLYYNILSKEECTCGVTHQYQSALKGSSEYSGDIVIPATVEYDGKTYTVTEIDSDAFYQSQVTSVELPNTIVKIQDAAFNGCKGLHAINLPNSLTMIGESAFGGCQSLPTIELPNSLTTIGRNAFWGCNFTSLTVPESVTIIGSGAFSDCKKLETVILPNTITELGAPTFYGSGGWVFSGCSSLKTVNIPTSISVLRATTFAACYSLESIEIPSNITSIELSAFYNCSSLTSIEIPATVTDFGSNPFWGCVNLEEMKFAGNDKYFIENNCLLSSDGRLITVLDQSAVTIPSTINTIDDGAFSICKSLQTVDIPNSVTNIGMYAFSGCKNLQSVRLPNSITSIPSNCFEYCSSLSEFEIPASVTKIGDNPFFGCSNLNKLTVEGGDMFFVEDDCLIDSRGALICVLDKEEVTIPNSVNFLNSFAIGGCENLSSIVIPSSVTSGNGRIISSCPNLKSIYCYCNPFYSQDAYHSTQILFADEDGDHHPDCKICVPKSMLDKFKQYWKIYADMIESIELYIIGDEITDENGNTYSITSVEDDNKTCELSKFSNSIRDLEKLVIPETVEGFAVTSINAKISSSRSTKTTTLTLPKTIKSICDKAFGELKKLSTVYCHSESMEMYGTEVFRANNDLKIYVLENSVETYKAAWPELADYIFPMDEEMDITTIFVPNTSTAPLHNLHGQPVNEDYKGIVIYGGKKMIRK